MLCCGIQIAFPHAALMVTGQGLWNDDDGFYYDHLRHPDGHSEVMRVRSMVGLIPLFACLVLEDEVIQKLPGFKKRMNWFMHNEKDLAKQVSQSWAVCHCHRTVDEARKKVQPSLGTTEVLIQ